MSDVRIVKSPDGPVEKAKIGFARSEEGNMLVFGLCIFVVMLMSSGMAIDFMRHENQRTMLQSTLDRAVLAAADLDQQNDPTAVVNDYFAKANLGNIELDVTVDEGAVNRNVRAVAATPVQSMFLNMLGIDQMDAPAKGAAEERVNNVEISLVLDVSGSMGRTANVGGLPKIHYLREAGQKFIDSLLSPSTEGRVSVSMVPYTGQTNAGADLMKYYNIDRVHDYSNCVEFEDSDFTKAKIDFNDELEQVQHFGWSDYVNAPISHPMCSDQPQDEIFPFQNSNAELKSRIAAFEPRTNTAIHTAMKWAVELLQPSFNSVVQGMISDGLVPSAFVNRPVALDDPETTKIIVLMTDGENVDQLRLPKDAYDTEEERVYWANNSFLNKNVSTLNGPMSTLNGTISTPTGTISGLNGNVFNLSSTISGLNSSTSGLYNTYSSSSTTVSSSGTVTTSTTTVSSSNGTASSSSSTVSSSSGTTSGSNNTGSGSNNTTSGSNNTGSGSNNTTSGSSSPSGQSGGIVTIQKARMDMATRDSADSNLNQICQVARSQGIVVFTIGFELGYSEHARNVLAACASSDAHAYEVDGVDLDATFSAVARTITQLRLTE